MVWLIAVIMPRRSRALCSQFPCHPTIERQVIIINARYNDKVKEFFVVAYLSIVGRGTTKRYKKR